LPRNIPGRSTYPKATRSVWNDRISLRRATGLGNRHILEWRVPTSRERVRSISMGLDFELDEKSGDQPDEKTSYVSLSRQNSNERLLFAGGGGGGATQLPSHFTPSPGGDCLNFVSLQINQMPVILIPPSPTCTEKRA